MVWSTRRMWSLGYVVVLTYLTLAGADDRVTCCMGGWKMMRGVRLCGAPCCPGYEERALNMPLLDTPTVCHKLTQEELRQREEARMTTPSPTTQLVDLLQDEPRRRSRTSSEYADFLYHHRHFFLRLLNQGYSRKDLLTKLEKFLEHLTSVVYKPDWFTD